MRVLTRDQCGAEGTTMLDAPLASIEEEKVAHRGAIAWAGKPHGLQQGKT